MVFSSISFMYYFLPVILLAYFAIPWKYKNWVLFLFSAAFYFFGEPVYIIILAGSTLLNYACGLYVEKQKGLPAARNALIFSVVVNVLLLGIFKYSDFVVENLNHLVSGSLPSPGLALPLGISFYTFQAMSYVVDVYRGDTKAQRSFVNFGTYLCMFPQLVAGPIVRYKTVADQVDHRQISFDKFGDGVARFTVGLAKKVILANNIGQLSSLAYGSGQESVVMSWVGALAFTLQIYFDFSGYSDMAIGLGKMLGFEFPENFNYPLVSKSVTEFWRRWHMTLGGWFRDYVYIPLGGNRVSKWKWIRNIGVVWFLTGLWHGASWNFVLWGLYFAGFLVLEKLVSERIPFAVPTWVKRLYTLLVIVISFVIFDNTDFSLLWEKLQGMLGLAGLPFINEYALYYIKSYAVVLLASLLGATPLLAKVWNRLTCDKTGKSKIAADVAEQIFLLVLLAVSTAYIIDSSFNPFLYFRF